MSTQLSDDAGGATFADFGRALGLAEDRIIDALCEAIELAGPSRGGRFVAPHLPVGDDDTSRVAVEAMQRAATG